MHCNFINYIYYYKNVRLSWLEARRCVNIMTAILKDIKKSISFIFIPTNDPKNPLIPFGTGFFLGVKNEVNLDVYNVYFVTAKHVLQDEKGEYFPEIVLRVNTHKNDSQLIKISTGTIKIYEHPDKDVDIALFACLPDEQLIDFKFIPDVLIAHKDLIDEHEITEGDDVFFTGLFTSHVGQKRNQPIIRFGKVALLPEEPIEWRQANQPPKFMDLYLLECQSFGGNSGSPVFFDLNPLRKPGQITTGKRIFLAGLMTGSFLHGSEVQAVQTRQNLISLQNNGIAAVTPSYKLHEILFSDELIASRKPII